MKALLVSPDPESRDRMRLALGSIERRIGSRCEFHVASDGEAGAKLARKIEPDVIVADEIASREGAFGMARDLRDSARPFPGVIVILLERKHDVGLARWSGADAWLVQPVDPFELADRVLELVTQKEPA